MSIDTGAMRDTQLPDPAAYGISPTLGFLSPDAPAARFQDPYYLLWDDIILKLHDLITNGELEKEVSTLSALSTDRLQSEIEYRRAYVVLGFLMHGYVWCRSPPNQHVPPQLAEPFLEVCKHLRMRPVLSYAGLCIWNWRIRNGGGMMLDNLDTLASFTGARGEAAFYHVPVLVEAEGGHLVGLLLDAMAASYQGSAELVAEALKETARTLDRMSGHLSKFRGVLEANFFYHGLRPFLAGGNGMGEKGLPHGIILQRSDGAETTLKLAGGSAAQSSLVPFVDVALGVSHKGQPEFNEIHTYMPGAHRDFLGAVSRLPDLRSFAEDRKDDEELRGAYNECLKQLKSWRGKHMAVVSKYIVQPARQAERAAPVEKLETSGPDENGKEWELQGTGGSALIPFLKQAKDDTVGI